MSTIGYMSASIGSQVQQNGNNFKVLFINGLFTLVCSTSMLSYVLGSSYAKTEGSISLALSATGIGVMAGLAGELALRYVGQFFENLRDKII